MLGAKAPKRKAPPLPAGPILLHGALFADGHAAHLPQPSALDFIALGVIEPPIRVDDANETMIAQELARFAAYHRTLDR